jgi:DNA-binding NarL/FixJ family response regulator
MTFEENGTVPPAVAAVIAAEVLARLGTRVTSDEAKSVGDSAVEALRADGWCIRAHPGRTLARAAPGLWEHDLPILAGLARGRTGSEIAVATSTPHATVRQRIRRMRTRTGAANSAELVSIAYRAGWLDALSVEPRAPIRLPATEARVLELLADGRTNDQIADELGVGTFTAMNCVRRLCNALDAARPGHPDQMSRCRAVALGYQHGLLTRPARRSSAA